MNKFIPTFKLTYTKKVFTKSFIITTLLLMLVIIGMSNIDKIIKFFDRSDEDVITVAAKNNQTAEAYIQALKDSKVQGKFKIVSPEDGKRGVEDEKYTRFVQIEEQGMDYSAKIYATEPLDGSDTLMTENILSALQNQKVAKSLNLSPQDLQALTKKATIDTEVLSKEQTQKVDESSQALNTGIVYVAVFLIFFITINYGSQAATEIAMEKSSRVIEMIVTSVSPVTHIMSKMLAIIAVAFTQMVVIGLTILACVYFSNLSETLDEFGLKFDEQSVRIIVYSLIFLVLGLLINISLASIIGALTNRVEDIGQAIMPITFMNIAAFYIAIFSLATPDTLLVRISSYIPFFTPMVMLLRTLSAKTTDVQIIIGIVICIVTIVILLMLAARVYKGSVFSYGKGLVKNFKQALSMK